MSDAMEAAARGAVAAAHTRGRAAVAPLIRIAARESGFKGLVVLEYEGDFDNMERRLAGMRQSLANMHRFIDGAARA